MRLNQTEDGDLSRDNALAKAQVMLLQAGRFGHAQGDSDEVSKGDAEPSDAVESLRQEQENRSKGGSALQEGLEDTYPASDPVSATYTSTAGGSKKNIERGRRHYCDARRL